MRKHADEAFEDFCRSRYCYIGGDPTPPPPPDYTGAAQATAASNQQQNTAATWANRPNITTPWGTSTWNAGTTTDPSTGQAVTNWTNNVALSPEQQAALTQQMQMQSGLSTAASGLLGQASGNFSTPWDTSGMTSMYNAGGPSSLNTSGGPSGPSFQQLNPNAVGGAASASTASGVDPTGQQTSIANNGNQIQRNVAGPGAYSDAATQAILARQQPLQDRANQQLQTQLANQGIQVGSEAYKNAMQDQGMQVNDANMAAITAGLAQGNTETNQALAQGQFRNAATGQQFQQGLDQGNFTNTALQNEFGQAATSANVQNQGAQIQNQANQFNVQNAQQNVAQQMAAQQANNQYAQQGYQNANNQYLQGNQALAQQQSLNTDYSNLTQQQRQQQLQEAMYSRNLPLNEMSALMNGQQVQQPQFSGPNSTAGTGAGTNYLQAAQLQNQYGMNMYNTQVGAANSQNSGLMGLAGTIGMGAMMFSDERLKDDIVPVGDIGGRSIYSYTYKGDDTPQLGFMAQDLEKTDPETVHTHESGFKMVDYGSVIQKVARELRNARH